MASAAALPHKPQGRLVPKLKPQGQRGEIESLCQGEHVFAKQKSYMGLFICTIGIRRAEATIMLADMVCNVKRWCWLDR